MIIVAIIVLFLENMINENHKSTVLRKKEKTKKAISQRRKYEGLELY